MFKYLFLFFFPVVIYAQENLLTINKLIANQEYFKAKEGLDSLIRKDNKNIEAIELLGDTYGYLKEWELAQNQYAKLIDFDSKNADYHYKYGGALGMRALEMNKFAALSVIGDLKNAFLNALKYNPEHIDASWGLLHLYMQLPFVLGGGKQKALDQTDLMMKISKVDGYLAKGEVYAKFGDFDLSEKNYIEALNIGRSKVCYLSLSKLYETHGFYKKSYEVLKEAHAFTKADDFLFLLAKLCNDYNLGEDIGEQYLNLFMKSYVEGTSDFSKDDVLKLKSDFDQS